MDTPHNTPARLSLLTTLLEELSKFEAEVERDGITVAKERYGRWQARAATRLREQFNDSEAVRLEKIKIPVRTGYAARRGWDDIFSTLRKCKAFVVALAEDVSLRAGEDTAAAQAEVSDRYQEVEVTGSKEPQIPKIQLSGAESKWLKLAYDWFKQGYLIDVERVSKDWFERGEWPPGFRPYDIDERLLVDGHKPTLLGVIHVDPGSPLLPLAHETLSHLKRRLATNRKTDKIEMRVLAPEVGAPPDQVSRAIDLIWLAGDLLHGYWSTAGNPNAVRVPGQLPVYGGIQVGHPVIFEEYAKYESLEKLIADRYGNVEEEEGNAVGATATNMILGRYELLKALVGHKAAIEAKIRKYPFEKNVFIMMKYRPSNKALSDFMKEELEKHGLRGVRADDPEWNITRDIYNPLAVLYCCKYGLALFDEAEEGQIFSPNVAYELGIMHYQQKDCLILKHTSLPTAPFDLLKDLHKPYSRDLEVRDMIRTWITEIADE